MYVQSGTCPLNYQCILLQVFDTSSKLNMSHSTETNSTQRGGVWFKGSCRISLSVTQNDCCLERATWKIRYRIRLKSIVLFQNCKMKLEKIMLFLKCKKMFLFEKIDKNVQFNSVFLGIPIFFCVCVRQVAFLSEDLKKLSL